MTPYQAPEGIGEDGEALAPKVSGLLADFLPFDLPSLGRAVQELVAQGDDWVGDLSGPLEGRNLAPWVMASGLAAVAYEVARRQLQTPQPGEVFAGGYQATSAVWLPGSADLSAQEQ